MNDKFLHITNGLNDQYPSPDIPADTAWADMLKLLDDDDDNTIAPPPIPPPSGGNSGYWKYGLLILLIAGIAVYFSSNKIQQAQTEKHTANSVEQKVDEQSNDGGQSFPKNDAIKENTSNNLAELLITRQHENNDDSLGNKIILPGTVSKIHQVIEIDAEPNYSKNNTTSPAVKEHPAFKNKKYTTSPDVRVKISEGSVAENNTDKTKSKDPETLNKNNQEIFENKLNVDSKQIPESKPANKVAEPWVINDSLTAEKSIKPLQQDTVNTYDASVTPGSSTLNNNDSIKNQQVSSVKPGKLKTDTASKVNSDKESKKIAWAAGLGLSRSFAVGSQEYSGYNANGTRSTIADYIPVPFIRGYLNKKLYLQLEAQFNAPQYTKQVLAKNEIIADSIGNREISTYINKLYYFNMPLSIHYSPSNNFNIGAGLQFSKLKNAVGLIELKQPGGSIKTNYTSLKNNSVYSEIKTKEWRILLDASYQWKNLVLGIRYNQAIGNFINARISPTQLTHARNSSVQLFVWYTLWKNKVF